MDRKKMTAGLAAGAALAAMLVPGSAFAADGSATLAIEAGEGASLTGHSFTAYRVAAFTDVVKEGDSVKSFASASAGDKADAWLAAALKANGVTVTAPETAESTLLRMNSDTDSEKLRDIASTLAKTVKDSGVDAAAADKTAQGDNLDLTLPEGFYLVVDAQGQPILVSTTIQGSTSTSSGQTLGKTLVKTTVPVIDKKIKSVDGTWKDSAAATNGETRDFQATFTLPNKYATDTVTLEDHMTGIEYVDGSFNAKIGDTDVTGMFGAPTRDQVDGKDGTGFKTTSTADLVKQYEGKQVTVTYKGKVVDASKANKAVNEIILTLNTKPGGGTDTPPTGHDETDVDTYDVRLRKVSAADGKTVLQGAKFNLHNDSTNQWYTWDAQANKWTFGTDESKATEFTTNEQGVIDLTRLGAGTYTVKETQVPDGYFSSIKPSFTITITDEGKVSIKGADQAGLTQTVSAADGKTTTPTAVVKNVDSVTQLPQTGAATMAVFLVGGAAIILAATAMGFAAYRVRHEHIDTSALA